MPNTRTLVHFLKSIATDARRLHWAKLVYRPVICPFDELLQWADRDNLFDIGCGSGAFCLLAARFRGVKRIGGLDSSAASVDAARRLLAEYQRSAPDVDIDIRHCNDDQLPDDLSTYDRFFLVDVLHHTPQSRQLAFLKRIHDLMPRGGRLVLKDMEADSAFVVFNKLHDFALNGAAGHELSGAFVEETLRDIGFSVQKTTHRRMWLYLHYTIVATK